MLAIEFSTIANVATVSTAIVAVAVSVGTAWITNRQHRATVNDETRNHLYDVLVPMCEVLARSDCGRPRVWPASV